jgi:hypothetical protein
MTDEKMTESRPVAQIATTVIDVGDVKHLSSGTIAETPGHSQPNLAVNVIGPTVAIIVRFVSIYLTIFLGLITAALTPHGQNAIPWQDFSHLLVTCATLSLSGSLLDLIKNLVTIFGRLEGKYPLLTGSV